jgi:CBS-domain-containing membrane protein
MDTSKANDQQDSHNKHNVSRRNIIVDNIYTILGLTLVMSVICLTNAYLKQIIIIPSLASSVIMIFVSYNNVFAQPRNVVGGHLLPALVAWAAGQLCADQWWAITVVVMLAAILMFITDTIHPPGGGTAVAVFIGGFPLVQLVGSIILSTIITVVAAHFIISKLPLRNYPKYWFK